jgi:hypothetical protein
MIGQLYRQVTSPGELNERYRINRDSISGG